MKLSAVQVSLDISNVFAGTSNFVNRKRAITVIESADNENERQKLLLKVLQKCKDIEDELGGTSNAASNRASAQG